MRILVYQKVSFIHRYTELWLCLIKNCYQNKLPFRKNKWKWYQRQDPVFHIFETNQEVILFMTFLSLSFTSEGKVGLWSTLVHVGTWQFWSSHEDIVSPIIIFLKKTWTFSFMVIQKLMGNCHFTCGPWILTSKRSSISLPPIFNPSSLYIF